MTPPTAALPIADCPFCDVAIVKPLIPGKHWHHPENHCYLSGRWIEPVEVEKWNRRAAPAVQATADEVAILENSFENCLSKLKVASDACAELEATLEHIDACCYGPEMRDWTSQFNVTRNLVDIHTEIQIVLRKAVSTKAAQEDGK